MAAPENLQNFMLLQSELVQRLHARLEAQHPAVYVLTGAELAEVVEEQQLTPAVHLVYQSYKVAESRPDGRAIRIEQTWLAVVACRNVRSLKSGEAARDQAGALAYQVMTALVGWQPACGCKPLRLESGPAAGYSGGHQYLPLAFVAEILFKPT